MRDLPPKYFYLFVDGEDRAYGVGKVYNEVGEIKALWYMLGSKKVWLDLDRLLPVMQAIPESKNKPGFKYVSYPEFLAEFEVIAIMDGDRVSFRMRSGKHTSRGQLENKAIATAVGLFNQKRDIRVVKAYFKEHPGQLSIQQLL